ncbi:MAG: DinB family protein [Lewinellaceae bacterium]|nr:DinB family protein [Lewinellaceae bacterium]
MTQNELLSQLETETRASLQVLRQHFSQLEEARLQFRQTPEGWTALECFAHLNAYFHTYLPRVEHALHKARARQWHTIDMVAHNPAGRVLIRRAGHQVTKRFKSSKAFNFSHQPFGPEEVKMLIIQCERLLRHIEAARGININKPRIRKYKSWFRRYDLGSVLTWLSGHTRRHIAQAERALAST